MCTLYDAQRAAAKNRVVKFGSLFAGIGGIDLGLERAGMKCAWQVEIDDYCQRVLEKHWPNVARFGDVRECGRQNLEPVDLICGGFPCQPHSVAGKQRGEEDDRDLWSEYLRIIRELRPRWVLGENVPGIRTTMLDQVLSDLDHEGYTAITLDIPAVAFDAPHRRHRYFIVAYAAGEGRQSKYGRGSFAGGATGEPAPYGKAVPDPDVQGLQNGGSTGEQEGETEKIGQVAQPESERCSDSWWAVEPDVGRVAHGIPSRVDRIKALGNAVVPQIAEWIGRRIIEADGRLR